MLENDALNRVAAEPITGRYPRSGLGISAGAFCEPSARGAGKPSGQQRLAALFEPGCAIGREGATNGLLVQLEFLQREYVFPPPG